MKEEIEELKIISREIFLYMIKNKKGGKSFT